MVTDLVYLVLRPQQVMEDRVVVKDMPQMLQEMEIHLQQLPLKVIMEEQQNP